jgi:hypothetical protein
MALELGAEAGRSSGLRHPEGRSTAFITQLSGRRPFSLPVETAVTNGSRLLIGTTK